MVRFRQFYLKVHFLAWVAFTICLKVIFCGKRHCPKSSCCGVDAPGLGQGPASLYTSTLCQGRRGREGTFMVALHGPTF